MIFTTEEIAEQMKAYKAALTALSLGQSYRIGERWLTRADLPEVRRTLEWLGAQEQALKGGNRMRVTVGRPLR